MELLEYWHVIRKRMWFILLLMVVSAGAATYYGYQEEPQYRATTTLFINPTEASPVLPLPYYQTREPVESLANTYIELLETYSFAQMVDERLDVSVSEQEILDALSAEYVSDTQFFRVSATHPDPETAEAIATAAARTLVAEETARREAQRTDPVEELERQNLVELQSNLQAELDYYDTQIEEIQQQIDQLQNEPPPDTEAARLQREQTISELRADLTGLRSSRVDIFRSLTDAQIALAGIENRSTRIETAAIVDPARRPTTPLSRHIPERALIGALAALILGIGLSFLMEYVDYTVHDPDQLSNVYGAPVLGAVGVVAGNEGREQLGRQKLITVTDPLSPNAEAFRSLRTSIQVAQLETPVRSILVTSARPDEGKTFVAANLAVSLAQNGNHVIIVDTDLRKPGLHRVFDLPTESRTYGFTNVVVDQRDNPVPYLQRTNIENLRVLPCGTVPPNPAELLGSTQASEVMRQLEQQVDIVVYDSSPAGTVTDPLVLAGRVDAVVQVVWAGVTRIDVVLECKEKLDRVGANILGPVLNRIELDEVGYGGYYDNYHENGDRASKESSFRQLLTKGS